MAGLSEESGSPSRRVVAIRDLAAAARARRRQLGLTQAAAAERAGTTRQWISQFETGKPTSELGLVLSLLDALELELVLTARGAPVSPADTPSSAGRVDLDELLDRYRGHD